MRASGALVGGSSDIGMSYCFWSVCEGAASVEDMRRCVVSARAMGVTEEFRVFSSHAVEGAQSYALEKMDLAVDRQILVYMKAGASGFAEDCLVWLENIFIIDRVDLRQQNIIIHYNKNNN